MCMAMKVFLVPVLVKVDVGRLDRYCRLPRYVLEPLDIALHAASGTSSHSVCIDCYACSTSSRYIFA